MKKLIFAVLTVSSVAACTKSADGPDTTVTSTSVNATTTTQAIAGWIETGSPSVSGSTDEVRIEAGSLMDGTYWATVSRVSGSGDVVFTVARAHFGDACVKWAAERRLDEGCMNDYAVDDADTAIVAMVDDASASVQMQNGPGTNYSITADVLRGLVRGTVTSPVSGYEWVPFPFVVEVNDGFVTSARQMWVP